MKYIHKSNRLHNLHQLEVKATWSLKINSKTVVSFIRSNKRRAKRLDLDIVCHLLS